MSNTGNRVLSRMGARDLTPEEIEQAAGSGVSRVSKFMTGTVQQPDFFFDD